MTKYERKERELYRWLETCKVFYWLGSYGAFRRCLTIANAVKDVALDMTIADAEMIFVKLLPPSIILTKRKDA